METSKEPFQELLEAIERVKTQLATTYSQPMADANLKAVNNVRGRLIEFNRTEREIVYRDHCLDRWLKEGVTVPLLFQHEEDLVIGEVPVFIKDKQGISVECVLNDSDAGKDAKTLIDAGVIDSFSICAAYDTDIKVNPMIRHSIREINEAEKIIEVSLVTYPGHACAVFEGKKSKTEEDIKDLLKRLDNFWKIDRKIRTKKIYDILCKEWKKINRLASN